MIKNVSDKSRTNKKEPKKTKYFTIEQKNVMLGACETSKQYLALLIGFELGERAGEVLTLKLEDINFHTRMVYVFDSKKKVYRRAPASMGFLSGVKRYCKDNGIKSGYLLKIHRITLTRWVKMIADKCNIEPRDDENIRYHSLRHSWIRHNSNKPLKYVCQVTGDKQNTILDIYSEFDDDDLVAICNGVK